MNVRELVEHLTNLPPDADVYVAADPEGNGFSDLHDINFSYMSDENYPIHPDDEDDYDLEGSERSVVLWP